MVEIEIRYQPFRGDSLTISVVEAKGCYRLRVSTTSGEEERALPRSVVLRMFSAPISVSLFNEPGTLDGNKVKIHASGANNIELSGRYFEAALEYARATLPLIRSEGVRAAIDALLGEQA